MPAKLSLVVCSGAFEKVHYALVMASAAAAVGTRATLFFTLEATRGLAGPGADGTPGWHALRPEEGASAAMRDAEYARRGVATFEELLESCGALGVGFMVCEMGLRAAGLAAEDLRPELAVSIGGVVGFLADAGRDAQIVVL